MANQNDATVATEETVAETKTKRNGKATKTIKDGTLVIEFKTGETLIADPAKVNDEIRARLTLHGLSQLLGDSYASVGKEEAHEKANAKWEQILGGEWTTQRGDGTTPSIVVQAIARHMAQVEGVKVESFNDDQDRLNKWVAMVKTKEGREKALANEGVKAHYEAIRQENQTARTEAAKAKAKAKAKTIDNSMF